MILVLVVASLTAFVGCQDNKGGGDVADYNVKIGTYKMTEQATKAMVVVGLMADGGNPTDIKDLAALKSLFIARANQLNLEGFEAWLNTFWGNYTIAKDFWKDYDKVLDIMFVKLSGSKDAELELARMMQQFKAMLYYEIKTENTGTWFINMGTNEQFGFTYTNDNKGNLVLSINPQGQTLNIDVKYKDGVISVGLESTGLLAMGGASKELTEFILSVVDKIDFKVGGDTQYDVKIGTYKFVDNSIKASMVLTLMGFSIRTGLVDVEDLAAIKAIFIARANELNLGDFEAWLDSFWSNYTTAKDFWKDYDKVLEIFITKLDVFNDGVTVDSVLQQLKEMMWYEIKTATTGSMFISILGMTIESGFIYTNDDKGNLVFYSNDIVQQIVNVKYKDGVMSFGVNTDGLVEMGVRAEFILSIVDKLDFALVV